jgi:hypothetical protein
MKGISLGPLGSSSYRESWTENGLKQVERWINTVQRFRGSTASGHGADGLVPQPKVGDEARFLRGDGSWGDPALSQSSGDPGSIQISDGDGGFTDDSDFGYDTTTDTLFAKHVISQDVTVNGEVYGPGWNNDNTVPTKNDVYDKMEVLATAVADVVPTPVFRTAESVYILPSVGRLEFMIMPAAVPVTPTSKGMWAMFKIQGSGTVRRKIRRNATWDFLLQLRTGSPGAYSYLDLVAATTTIKASGVANNFVLSLQAFLTPISPGTYDIVLISNYTGKITPGAVQVSVMGQVP